MFQFVMFIILAVVALGALIASAFFTAGQEVEHPRRSARRFALVALGGAAIFAFLASVYTQSPGEARIVLNFGGSVSHVDTTAGISFKAPWQTTSDWSLLSRGITYAGTDRAPKYTNGRVEGEEVTVSLANGIQGNVDIQGTYSLTSDHGTLIGLYERYRNQEAFTSQVIQPAILSTLRETPGALAPSAFRGDQRTVVESDALDALNAYFQDHEYGVVVASLNLQDIRFSEDVEASLREVEVAQQREATAQANLRATEVESQAQVVQATAAAEANRLLSESLTPAILAQRLIDAYDDGTVFVVPEGTNPLVTLP